MPHGELPEGVRRDPDTGKFVAQSDADPLTFRDHETINGTLHGEVPAADLSGQTFEDFESDDFNIIQFGRLIDDPDEVAEIAWLRFVATLEPHTTATAEGHAGLGYELSEDTSLNGMGQAPPFFAGSDFEELIADYTRRSREANAVLVSGRLGSSPSHSDSTNGLAGGADYGFDAVEIPFRDLYGIGPMYDQFDDLFVPHRFEADNISDHAVTWSFAAQAVVRIWELE